MKTNEDYYNQIDKALLSYEQYKPYHPYSLEWICDRITWCNKFRKLTTEQIDELCDRATDVINASFARKEQIDD